MIHVPQTPESAPASNSNSQLHCAYVHLHISIIFHPIPSYPILSHHRVSSHLISSSRISFSSHFFSSSSSHLISSHSFDRTRTVSIVFTLELIRTRARTRTFDSFPMRALTLVSMLGCFVLHFVECDLSSISVETPSESPVEITAISEEGEKSGIENPNIVTNCTKPLRDLDVGFHGTVEIS